MWYNLSEVVFVTLVLALSATVECELIYHSRRKTGG